MTLDKLEFIKLSLSLAKMHKRDVSSYFQQGSKISHETWTYDILEYWDQQIEYWEAELKKLEDDVK